MTKLSKKKVGRPRFDQEKPLENRLILRVSQEEKEAYENASKLKSLTLSAWMRFILNNAAKFV